MAFFDIWRQFKLTYLRVLKNLFRIVLISSISHYGKFTAFHKLILIVYNWRIEASKNFRRNHAVSEVFFKIALRTRLFICLQLIVEKNIVKPRLSSWGAALPNLSCWQRNNLLQGLNEVKESGQKTNTLVTGNKSDEKNLHPSDHFLKFFQSLFWRYSLFFIILFCFFFILVSFAVVTFLLFFELKNVYSDTYSTTRSGEWQNNFHPADSRKQESGERTFAVS